MADFYTLLTNAGIAYETACKAAGVPIKLAQISVGDGNGSVYNPDATAKALKREVWRGPLNALFQDEKNPSWLLAEVTIPPEVGGWYVRDAGLWTDTGVLYAIVKYPESFKPVLATSGSGKEFYIRSIFETSNASLVTLLIDDTVVKATRAWVIGYVADELAKLDAKQSVRVATTANITLSSAQTIDGVAVVAGDRVLVKNQTTAKDNGLYVVTNAAWVRTKDADASAKVTSAMTVSIEQGRTQADTIWQLVTDGEVVLGVTSLSFQNVTQGFAPLNSPALINPTANTPPLFDSTKAIATTEFVRRSLGGFSGALTISSSRELTADDAGTLIWLTENCTLSLPAPASLGLYIGCAFEVFTTGIGATLSFKAGAKLQDQSGAIVNSFSMRPGQSAKVVATSNTQWLITSSTAGLGKNSDFAASLQYSGYKKEPSGLITQWGSTVSSGAQSGNWAVTLPITFPTACLSASILGNGGATTFSVLPMPTNALIATAMNSTNGEKISGLGGFFIAIGY
ncbi:phage tail protein [Pseudomonas sp. FP2338]|uniref:phage tail protein n=1 Tax=Pseudomonas sp. FP2338 TaxID=2954093 RepID=UPI0027354430|nr:phage tail protein [Pseudomonas sp. FP2338]WLH86055.1 phage tail protein [Pseudomonas sp. FP2338]